MVTYNRTLSEGTWDAKFEWGSGATPFSVIAEQYIPPKGSWFYPGWDDPEFEELLMTAKTTIDDVERGVLLEKVFLRCLDSCVNIQICLPMTTCYWWPWVKNYWGEVNQNVLRAPVELMWIDQNLKEEMLECGKAGAFRD